MIEIKASVFAVRFKIFLQCLQQVLMLLLRNKAATLVRFVALALALLNHQQIPEIPRADDNNVDFAM